LDGVDGGTLVLSGLEGPAVVNLWATWCTPCRTELPLLQAEYVRRAGEIAFVGVNIGDEPDDVAKFVAEVGVTFPQYVDTDDEVLPGLGVVGLPTTVFVGRDGSLTVHSGALSADELSDALVEISGVR
jgi:thiol-disulfide isomerase/thioredoxin